MLKEIDPLLLDKIKAHSGATPSWGVKFVAPNLKGVSLNFMDTESRVPSGYIIKRRDFDNILIDKARKKPIIKLIENLTISKIIKKDGGFMLFNDDGSQYLECKLLIIASGNKYRKFTDQLQHQEDAPVTKPGIGIRTYFSGVKQYDDYNNIELHFYKELLPWYLWIFPMGNNQANVGMGLPHKKLKEKNISMKDLLFRSIEKHKDLRDRFRNANATEPVMADQLHYFTGRKTITGPGYMLTGDAARLIDPFTGEGVGNAILSGLLSARTAISCIKENDFSHNKVSQYQDELYEKIGDELEMGQRLQKKAQNAFLINLVIGKARHSKTTRELLGNMIYNINTMGELSKPLFYLKIALNL